MRPDGKTQVSVEYDEDGNVQRIDSILISTQHDEIVTQEGRKKFNRTCHRGYSEPFNG